MTLAGELIELRVEARRFARLRGFLSMPLLLGVAAIAGGAVGADDLEPAFPTRVVLARKSDGATLHEFRYGSASDARHHAGDIARRLADADVVAFCEELGIDPGAL